MVYYGSPSAPIASGKRLLPESIVLDEIDMVACHTGIYAGQTKAPNTWKAYQSGSFWAFIMERWGNGCPKPLLKRVLYSGRA